MREVNESQRCAVKRYIPQIYKNEKDKRTKDSDKQEIRTEIQIEKNYIYIYTYLFSKDSKDSSDFCFLIPKDCLSRSSGNSTVT